MFKFFINISFILTFVSGFSQEKQEFKENSELEETLKDSIIYKTAYGLRLGLDLSKPIKSFTDDSYSGLEIVGDYRLSKRLFIATEIGFEEKTTSEDFTNSTSKGNYIRLGLNLNAYENWLDMNNEITVGFRYGFSLFEQTLNSFTPNVNNLENGQYFPANLNTTPITESNLNAHWTEFVVGIKVETLANLFVSFSGSYKILLSIKDPENFAALYAPGFNRIFESGTGFGFNYTISYLIPFTKK